MASTTKTAKSTTVTAVSLIALLCFIGAVSAHTTTDPDHSPIHNESEFVHPSETDSHENHGNSKGFVERTVSFVKRLFGVEETLEETVSKDVVASWVMDTYRSNVVNQVFYVKEAEMINITDSKYPSFYRMHFTANVSNEEEMKSVLVDKKGEKVYFERDIKIPEDGLSELHK